MSTVYVLNKDGKPLMPTTRCGHVRYLLKEKKARVVKTKPFTIQLLYETNDVVQPLYLCKCTATFTRTPCIIGNTCSAAHKIICRRRAGTKTPFGIEQNLSYRAKLRVNVLSSGSTVRRTGTVCT